MIEREFNKSEWRIIGPTYRCHKIKHKTTGEEVVIPSCWNVVVSGGDLDNCICPDNLNDYLSMKSREKLIQRIKELEQEVELLKK